MKAAGNKEIVLLVFPFRAYPKEPEWERLAESFTDELISNFSRFQGLSVIALFSARQVKSLGDLEILKKLNPDYVVAGSLRSRKERLGIHAQLIRTTDWKVVFAFDQEESPDAFVHSQERLVQQMVNVLRQQINFDLLSYSAELRETKFPAYKNWLLGMNCLKRSDRAGNEEARNFFEQALQHDPNYARAYSGISLSYMNEWSCQLWERWDVSSNGARMYAEKALELDPTDYVSLLVMGRIQLFAGNYEKAEHFLRKSLLMNPGDASNLLQVSFCFMFLGYLDEAEKFYLKACMLNPLHEETYFSYGSNIYFEKGDLQQALDLGKKVDLERTWIDFPVYMAAIHFELGDPVKAEEYWNSYLRLFKKHAFSGTKELAKEALQWHLNVNPYKDSTRLKTYRDHLKKTIGFSEALPQKQTVPGGNSFMAKGDFWELVFQGEKVLLKDMKGLHDLQILLERAGEEISCLDLVGTAIPGGQGVELIDDKARADYKRKLTELKQEIEEMYEQGQAVKAERLQEEYDRILSSLGRAVGLGGKTRKTGSVIEKSRSAVTWRIRSAISKIRIEHPALGKHLQTSVKTGSFCAYKPAFPVKWQLNSALNPGELTL